MKIRVLAFATAAEAIGSGETEIELPAEATVADLRQLLQGRFPDLGLIWERLAIAVDGELTGDTAPLTDGAEIALLPPVSGGRPESTPHLTDTSLDPQELIDDVAGPSRGAVLVFLGTVRDNHAGRPVSKLTYEAYRAMAETILARIEADAEDGVPELRLRIRHRLGEVGAGEASVAIAVASPHRQASYDASRTALERLKREVPIWKREHYVEGEAEWREEEPLDVSPRA